MMLLAFIVVLFAGLAFMFFAILRGQERMGKALRQEHALILERLDRLERLDLQELHDLRDRHDHLVALGRLDEAEVPAGPKLSDLPARSENADHAKPLAHAPHENGLTALRPASGPISTAPAAPAVDGLVLNGPGASGQAFRHSEVPGQGLPDRLDLSRARRERLKPKDSGMPDLNL